MVEQTHQSTICDLALYKSEIGQCNAVAGLRRNISQIAMREAGPPLRSR